MNRKNKCIKIDLTENWIDDIKLESTELKLEIRELKIKV
jgi:hypothetical protein